MALCCYVGKKQRKERKSGRLCVGVWKLVRWDLMEGLLSSKTNEKKKTIVRFRRIKKRRYTVASPALAMPVPAKVLR